MARDQLQSVAQIREIMKGETAQAAEAMLLLRPRWKTADRDCPQIVVLYDARPPASLNRQAGPVEV